MSSLIGHSLEKEKRIMGVIIQQSRTLDLNRTTLV
jgi:hypothetical protein